jgi:hypothetical protein
LDLPIILLGILIGLILAAKEIAKNERRKATQRPDTQTGDSVQQTPTQLPSTTEYTLPTSFTPRTLNDSVSDILRDAAREADVRRGIPRSPPRSQVANETFNGKRFIENWRQSVVGLIKLAESNLQIAKSQAAILNHKASAEAAATSVENVSRALLHCFGEKPDLNSGQEEPLRLLARRLQGEERARFERAIDEAVQLCRNKIVQSYLSEKNIQAPLLNTAKTQQILETAMRIVNQFKQIIDEHFATEIPELRERCPKCGAINITLWTFGSQGSTYQCYVCSYKWVQPTQ